ncbi:curli assembly protein CsgF [Cognatishimia sp. MH4019]|uniref:curli assembly protein CsgF n=1 Tax=Cognatishimia sp. MH4019 TaxID=2854030 RepID=UPI001CD76E14|nr:curli assembly protein CsgF [Cognatishimia sp. MH4019]
MFRLTHIVLISSLFAGTAFAGDLIYRPINPAFGGNPNNFDYLLGTAQIQNQHLPDQGSGGGGGGVPNIDFPDISIDLGGATQPAPTTTPLAATNP